VALLVVGQLLFKIGMKDKTFTSFVSIIKTMLSPVIMVGLALYAGTTVLWLYILSKVPISRAHPIQALAYPAVMILASFMFGETIPPIRWAGIAVVLVGVVMIAQ
jgi:drug/metabolite transporter (DMT)-like permease